MLWSLGLSAKHRVAFWQFLYCSFAGVAQTVIINATVLNLFRWPVFLVLNNVLHLYQLYSSIKSGAAWNTQSDGKSPVCCWTHCVYLGERDCWRKRETEGDRGSVGRSMWTPSLACQAWRTSLAQISSPPHSSLPLFPRSLFLSLTCGALTLPTLFLSLHSVLFLATLLSPGSVENVIWGQKSWWLSGFRHHEWVPPCTVFATFSCPSQFGSGVDWLTSG